MADRERDIAQWLLGICRQYRSPLLAIDNEGEIQIVKLGKGQREPISNKFLDWEEVGRFEGADAKRFMFEKGKIIYRLMNWDGYSDESKCIPFWNLLISLLESELEAAP